MINIIPPGYHNGPNKANVWDASQTNLALNQPTYFYLIRRKYTHFKHYKIESNVLF